MEFEMRSHLTREQIEWTNTIMDWVDHIENHRIYIHNPNDLTYRASTLGEFVFKDCKEETDKYCAEKEPVKRVEEIPLEDLFNLCLEEYNDIKFK